MECRRCHGSLERPGDYCLACETANADVVVLDLGRGEARVHVAFDGKVVGESVLRTSPHDDDPERAVELRNFAGRVADEVRRRRPEAVYVLGEPDSEVLDALRRDVRYEVRRAGTESVDEVLSASERPEEVTVAPADKVSGRHSTLIGGRRGADALAVVAGHPNVKKIVPGPIDSTGRGRGFAAKVTRAGDDGNLRMLVRDGSSVQENRVVTTARDREQGERVREEIDDMLGSEGLSG